MLCECEHLECSLSQSALCILRYTMQCLAAVQVAYQRDFFMFVSLAAYSLPPCAIMALVCLFIGVNMQHHNMPIMSESAYWCIKYYKLFSWALTVTAYFYAHFSRGRIFFNNCVFLPMRMCPSLCALHISAEKNGAKFLVHRDQNRETKRGRKATWRGDKKMWFSPYGPYTRIEYFECARE